MRTGKCEGWLRAQIVISVALKSESESESRLLVSDSHSPWSSPGQNTGVGSLIPSPGDLPNPGTEPRSPALQADSLPIEPPGKPLIKFIYLKKYFF